MAHGGARPGAGRKPGSKNKRDLDWRGEMVADPGSLPSVDTARPDALTGMSDAELGAVSPLGFLTRIYRNRALSPAVRTDAAKAALPYAHARLAAPKEEQPGFADLPGAGDSWGDDLPPMSRRN